MKRAIVKYETPTAEILLAKLKELLTRHEMKTVISVDTLALVLKLKPSEILPLVETLEETGRIQRHIPATTSKRMQNMGGLSVVM
jgi:hypothetical protein